jgi:single-strand DNA-binding protein
MYLNAVTLIGFVGADPKQRASRGNGGAFTVLSLATQRSWKNSQDQWTSKTEWHRVCIFRPQLSEYALQNIEKGSHVLVTGSLISSIYERPNGKGEKATATKITSWSIRADVVRRLDRGELDPEVATDRSEASEQYAEESSVNSI